MNPLEPMMAASRGSLVWGKNDCCEAVSQVFLKHIGIDLMGRWRGRYTTQIGAARIVRRDGFDDLCCAVTTTAIDMGFEPVDQPADMDLGLVQIHDMVSGKDLVLPAVFLNGLWNMRGPHGFLIVDHKAKEVLRWL